MPIQVALNWYIYIDVMIPIVKASNLKHLEENAGAMEWKLSKEDWEAIAKAR
ncbi:aldo/keto reductase [Sulfolobus sp. S-194]|uniref:aldo/keto reductase n=1 Tax=Sulfolobus sp. S-194 TaxID=2512240 RepID=UPI00256FE038|nr:aldo/keto reductase [Sulfolobus sp. S-194]